MHKDNFHFHNVSETSVNCLAGQVRSSTLSIMAHFLFLLRLCCVLPAWLQIQFILIRPALLYCLVFHLANHLKYIAMGLLGHYSSHQQHTVSFALVRAMAFPLGLQETSPSPPVSPLRTQGTLAIAAPKQRGDDISN